MRPSSSGPSRVHLRRVVHHLLDVVFPRTCAACRAGLDEWAVDLCEDCARGLAVGVGGDHCCLCGRDVGDYLLREGRCTDCLGSRPAISRLARIGRYEGVLRDLILAFKREHILDDLLGRMLAEVFDRELASENVSALVPVPSPFLRRWRRGYQPTALLARQLARRTRVTWQPLLEMALRVRPQTGLSAAQREANIRGAFRVVPGLDGRDRTICLVDDVTTTGATLREAARVLRAGGAARIVAIVVAKASL